MVGDARGGTAAAGGSSTDIAQMLSGYATQEWTQNNFLSIAFFNRLFTIHASASDPTQLVQPNDMETTINNIQAMFAY